MVPTHSRTSRLSLIAPVLLTLAATAHAGPRISASLDTSRTDYGPTCPYMVSFTGRINGDPGATVRYRFLRSDGASAPEEEAILSKAGSVEVSTSWTLGLSYDGWQAIEVLEPERIVSDKAFFRLTCRPDPYADTSGQVKVSIDHTVVPAIERLTRDDGAETTVAAIADQDGVQAEFVENELMVSSDNRAAIDSFLERWGGTILHDYGEPVFLGMARLYHVKIDPSTADAAALEVHLKRLEPRSRGEYRVSSAGGLKLLAAAAQEAVAAKITVGVNWVVRSTSFATGSTSESPAGPDLYTSDAYQWPYMTRGPSSVQNIGVADAWTLLDRDGRLADPRKIRIAILDAGFSTPAVNGDYPAASDIFGSFGAPNLWPTDTGGRSRWHGTKTANAAMGVADNGAGAAGPAGPVASATLIESPAPDVASIVRYLSTTLPAGLSNGNRIMNMSFSVAVPGAFAGLGELMNHLTRSLRSMGVLIFAAAGNTNVDVDARDLSWERTWFIPCENDGVICVGSLARNSTMRNVGVSSGSNFGTNRDQLTTVRIFGPNCVFTGPDHDVPGMAQEACGTSIASPFVAGVAALVWSANREMSADDVERLLLGYAQRGSPDPTVSAIVDAFSSVSAALPGRAGVPPASVSCSSPQRFRVAVNGFRVNRETIDDAAERDGAGDEVFFVAETAVFDATGAMSVRSSPRSVVMGDMGRADGEPRIRAGTRGAAGLGGLRTGDPFPSSSPSSRAAAAPLFADRPAMLLFDGTLAADQVLLALPTIWEYDPRGAFDLGGSDGRDVGADWAEPVLRSAGAMAAFARGYLASTPPASPLFAGSAVGLTGLGRTDLAQNPHNRPIGVTAVGDRFRFQPTAVALGCSAALDAARTNVGFGAGVIPITYRDQPGRDLNGDYTLFVQVEWLPF